MRGFSVKSLGAAFAAAAMFAITACATPTPYQPLNSSSAGGGYSEFRITSDRYRVSFQGNSLTERDTVERYLLYRAAELTVQQGYDWFALVNRDVERQTDAYQVPRTETYWAWQPVWYQRKDGSWVITQSYQPFWGESWETRIVNNYMATAEVFLGRGGRPANDTAAFDAREVLANLEPTIMRPQA